MPAKSAKNVSTIQTRRTFLNSPVASLSDNWVTSLAPFHIDEWGRILATGALFALMLNPIVCVAQDAKGFTGHGEPRMIRLRPSSTSGGQTRSCQLIRPQLHRLARKGDLARASSQQPEHRDEPVLGIRGSQPRRDWKDLFSKARAPLRWEPESTYGLNNLAWYLAIAPAPHRDGFREVKLARRALAIQDDVTTRDTLVAALVAAGNRKQAYDAYIDVMTLDQRYGRYYQLLLKDKGYYLGTVDGVFGALSKDALRSCVASGCQLVME